MPVFLTLFLHNFWYDQLSTFATFAMAEVTHWLSCAVLGLREGIKDAQNLSNAKEIDKATALKEESEALK